MLEDVKNDIRNKMNEVFDVDTDSLHQKLVSMAKKWDGKVYLVGGAVRDELMGNTPKDMDYVVTGIERDELAKELLKTLPGSKVNEAGENFGIVIVNIGNDQFEFAVPRSDIDRDTVSTDPNLPIEQDLLRRDLTINAMAKDLETGEIVGPEGFDAQDDLKNGVIRSVGDPKDRFKEDPLRILRAIQFSSRLGFDIDPQTLKAIKVNVDDLQKVSGERFKEEFAKGWTKGNADTEKFFDLLEDTGIGKLMFGKDFEPIAIDLSKIDDEYKFRVQNMAAFLNGGDYEVMNKSNDDQKDIEAARLMMGILEQGRIESSQVAQMAKMADRLDAIAMMIDATDKNLLSVFKDVTSKPIVPFVAGSDSEWQKWMLPLKGGEIISTAQEKGVELKGKAVSTATLKLIDAYQNGDITIADSLEKSKEQAKEYISNDLLTESAIKDSVRADLVKDRLKNILNNS